MKIASVIKPRSGKPRIVTIHDREYAFASAQDKDDQTHYVAEVKNEDHAAILLGSGNFYAYGENLQREPQLKPVAPAKSEPVAETVPEGIAAEADALLELSVVNMSVEIGNVSSTAVIVAALAAEQAKPAPRASAVDLLKKTLDMIATANVKG